MSELDRSKFKKCGCGTQVDTNDCLYQPKFSAIGWFFITIMGTTINPIEIKFSCKKCGETFETVTDKNLIKYYELYKQR